jgi:hypothetical protein
LFLHYYHCLGIDDRRDYVSMRPANINEPAMGSAMGSAMSAFARAGLLTVVLVFSGCSLFGGKFDTPPVEPNILPTNYRANLLDFLQNHLTDPSGVRDANISEPKLQPIGTESRYVVCLRYNAKDGYGQYVGIRDSIAIYFAGKLTQFVPATVEQCANAAYQRFPQLEALKRPGQ